MTSIRLPLSFILITLIAQFAFAQEQDKAFWDKDKAQKEIDGMRRYSWAISEVIAKKLQESPAEDYPGIHSFLRDLDTARKAIDPQQPPSDWKPFDLESIAIRNPHYWAAVYEVEPAAPLMMWLHTTLHAMNGEIFPTFHSQMLALRTPVAMPQKQEMFRLIASSVKLIQYGQQGVQARVRSYDAKDYDQAAKIFRDVLSVIPSHSTALYELGFTLRTIDRGAAGSAAAQRQFLLARQFNPFMLETYQGSFNREEIKRLSALQTQAKPGWDKLLSSPTDQDKPEDLENLSTQLQAAGLHEFGLIVRQLAVAHRGKTYQAKDRQFIMASLQKLLPKESLEKVVPPENKKRTPLPLSNF